MARRNIIDEIVKKKSRLFHNESWELLRVNLLAMDNSIYLLDVVKDNIKMLEKASGSHFLYKYLDEVYNYFPIRCVACVEGYFRLIYAYLIDYGYPFNDNAKQFKVNMPNDNSVVSENSFISFGDYVSHSVKTSSFEVVNQNTSTLIGKDFMQLCRHKYLKTPSQFGDSIDPDIEFDLMISKMKNMFNVRHIYCHELGIPQEETLLPNIYLDNTLSFLLLADMTIHDLAPRHKSRLQ